MEFENWFQLFLIFVGLMILWGFAAVILRLARRVISCGCSLILAAGLMYLILRWLSSV